MNTFDNLTLAEYIKKFKDNLHEKSCIHPGLEDIFRHYTFITFNQSIKSLTKSYSSPLPLYFDSPASMKPISTKTSKIKDLFNFMDFNGIGRIDAYEFITPILLISSGPMDKFWDSIIENFGVEQDGSISSDEFFYFVDSLFRGLSKILVLKDEDPAEFKPRNLRLEYKDISNIIQMLFKGEEFVNKDDLKANAQEFPNLVEFLEYIHEMGSAVLDKKIEKPDFKAFANRMRGR